MCILTQMYVSCCYCNHTHWDPLRVHCPRVPTHWDLTQDQRPESNFGKHTLLFVIVISLSWIPTWTLRESSGCSGEGLFSDAFNAPYQQIRLLLSVEMVHNSDAGINSSDFLLLSVTQKTNLHPWYCSLMFNSPVPRESGPTVTTVSCTKEKKMMFSVKD